MFFEPGFLGTRAAVYMDIVTLYFAILPFLLAFSIRQAVVGRIDLHYKSQMVILALTVVMVLIFEIGVRLGGGFVEYVKLSNVSYDFLLLFLAVHILIALLASRGLDLSDYHLLSNVYKRRNRRYGKTSPYGKMDFWSLNPYLRDGL